MKWLPFTLLIFVLGTFHLPCFADDSDKLVFNNGKELIGSVEEETDTYVKFKDKFGSRKYPKKDIKEVIRGGASSGGNEAGDGKITKPTKVDTNTEIEAKMGLTLTKMRTQHFFMMSEFDEAATIEYLNLYEKVYDDFCKFWQVDTEALFPQPCNILFFSSQETYRRYVDKFVIREQMDEAQRNQAREGGGSYGLGGYTSFKDEERMPSHEDFKPKTLHAVGHIMLMHYKVASQSDDLLPAWLSEGYASHCEFKYFKKAGASCVSSGSKTGRTLDEGWNHGEDWHDLLKETLENEELEDFSTILNIDLNAMTYRELAHAWSMVTFLVENHADKFRGITDAFKERGKKEQLVIFKEILQWTTKDFEKEWHKFLKRKK